MSMPKVTSCQCLESEHQWSAQPQKRCPHPYVPALRYNCGRGDGKVIRATSWEGWCKMESSGHDKFTIQKNSQYLWLSAQDLQKIKPVNILVWEEEGLISFHYN